MIHGSMVPLTNSKSWGEGRGDAWNDPPQGINMKEGSSWVEQIQMLEDQRGQMEIETSRLYVESTR